MLIMKVWALTFPASYFMTDNFDYYKFGAQNNFKIYKNPAVFLQYQKGNSVFGINPVLNLQGGLPSQFGKSMVNNGRGIEVRGNLERKLAFYVRVTENQSWLPRYAKDFTDSFGVLPGYGFWKNFKTGGADYSGTTGYINAGLINTSEDSNYLVMTMGHGSFQNGPGYRSLTLSNFATPFLFLKFNTRIGRFRYQNLFGQLNGFTPLTGNTLLPKKYLAMHRASLLFGNKRHLEIGFSEMIIHSRNNGSGGFDLDYLNPIIFYRTIESNLGSKDNALMALDARWSNHNLSFYGQFLLDEFKLKYMKAGKWWGNKWGMQLGATQKGFIPGIGTLFFQQEFNYVRPYTYSHADPLNSYTHYNQPLAHPLESNFWEVSGRIYYQPSTLSRLRVTIAGFYAKKGFDPYIDGPNYGCNLRRDNDTRVQDQNVKMLQGKVASIVNFRTDITYMIRHNLNLDLGIQSRTQTGFRPTNGLWITGGLRLNFEPANQLY